LTSDVSGICLTPKYARTFVCADGDDGVDSELLNDADHRVRSGVNRLIAEINDETLPATSPLALLLTTAGSRAFDADIVGDRYNRTRLSKMGCKIS